MAKEDIEAVKAANPILDVLRDLGIPSQNNRIRCLKPENHSHGDRTPSVSVWPDRGQFKCWVCADVKGDVIDLVKLARNCSFREALEFLGRNTLGNGLPPPFRPMATGAIRHPPGPLRGNLDGPTSGMVSSPPDRPFAGNPLAAADSGSKDGGEPSLDFSARPSLGHSPESPPPPRKGDGELEAELLRIRILASLLEACPPIGGKVAQYLQKRRIFKRTWDSQKLRMIDDYSGVSRKLEAEFGSDDLARMGFFNAAGHLRYYRHKLLFPYFDQQGRPVYMQARAIDADPGGPRGPAPKELSMSGHIPLPYNCRLLNGEPGQIYLCEGVIDTLTLLEQGFPSVGVPGAANFKPAWAALFRNKTVHVAFDPDAPGESGAAKTIEKLAAHGIEARRLAPPTGM
ncbi:MAG: CHC2 zinc finger domain-containing protein, partial [Fibrobacterota bacterium]|nr:CHC2 zinc finger domain-containing protein [Fibrobacterota bacterium]